MKFCYVDESGTGAEPFLVMVGVVVDAKRMHKTKDSWDEFLNMLSNVCKRRIQEFHASDFYSGNGVWRGITGPQRADIISAVLTWWGKRKHHLTFTAIDKEKHNQLECCNELFEGCSSFWQTAAIHIVLSIQKYHQNIGSNKGHTLFLFDKQVREEVQLSNFVSKPFGWTDEYYDRGKKQNQLDQIIDVPFFGDSKEVLLLQVADIIAFILRRYAEISEGKSQLDYSDEMDRLKGWIALISTRCYPSAIRWPSRRLNRVQVIFDKLAPSSLKKICAH